LGISATAIPGVEGRADETELDDEYETAPRLATGTLTEKPMNRIDAG
jgi:hypothetical protein